MNKAISTILEKDEVEFENLQIERYMRWCIYLANKTAIPLQSILANSSINRYYNFEFSKLENKFLNLIEGKSKFMSIKTLQEMYEIIVVDMHNLYPMALLQDIRKPKTQTYMLIHGEKISLLNFNLN